MENRYIRNIPAISEEDQSRLRASHVLVAGCGGLGGNIIEQLARLGVGHLTVVDGDVFNGSDLNRQLLCTADNLGTSKALAAAARVMSIDPEIKVTPVCEYLTQENAATLMADADLVMDALDSIEARLMLEDAASFLGKYIVHGAVSGWELHAMLLPPGSGCLRELYAEAPEQGSPSTLAFTPAVCAGIQCALAVRYLCGYIDPAGTTMLAGSLESMDFELISL